MKRRASYFPSHGLARYGFTGVPALCFRKGIERLDENQ